MAIHRAIRQLPHWKYADPRRRRNRQDDAPAIDHPEL